MIAVTFCFFYFLELFWGGKLGVRSEELGAQNAAHGYFSMRRLRREI